MTYDDIKSIINSYDITHSYTFEMLIDLYITFYCINLMNIDSVTYQP